MTYNVHSCRGLDFRVRPERIARVIAAARPDLVALQELDVNRRWSGRADQPRLIAEALRMHFHFQPSVVLEGEHYGIAVLSRFPIEIEKAGHLVSHGTPRLFAHRFAAWLAPFFEPREAILCRVKTPSGGLYFMNTHLSLRGPERLDQARELARDWLGSIPGDGVPFIFCGDFNAGPGSEVYALFSKHLREACAGLDGRRNTFTSLLPFTRVDHIFYRGPIAAAGTEVPLPPGARAASDHLPLVADFHFNGNGTGGRMP